MGLSLCPHFLFFFLCSCSGGRRHIVLLWKVTRCPLPDTTLLPTQRRLGHGWFGGCGRRARGWMENKKITRPPFRRWSRLLPPLWCPGSHIVLGLARERGRCGGLVRRGRGLRLNAFHVRRGIFFPLVCNGRFSDRSSLLSELAPQSHTPRLPNHNHDPHPFYVSPAPPPKHHGVDY